MVWQDEAAAEGRHTPQDALTSMVKYISHPVGDTGEPTDVAFCVPTADTTVARKDTLQAGTHRLQM